jgi:radical SAM superfamily enzyme YgiQ (UPF0313 family)
MKVLLVSPNIETLPDPVFPLGMAYIAAALQQHQIPYQVLDLCFTDNYETALLDALDAWQPDLVGLSLRNVDNVSYPMYTSYLAFYKQVVTVIRQRSTCPIVVGGSAFALMPEKILAYLGADYGVTGEGEIAMVRLVKRLENQAGTDSPRGPKIMDGHADFVANLDDLPSPDRSSLDNATYLQLGGMANIQTKRGCPFKCIYCTYPIIEGRRVRMRSPKRICDEIETLQVDYGIENIFVVDNEFNFPMEHAMFVCQEISQRRLNVKWSCYAIPGHMNARLLEAMQTAGCTGVEFGSDAAEQAMLQNLGKDFSVDALIGTSKLCHQAGMPFCHSLLLGGPGETLETVHATLDAIAAMSPTAVICMIGIRVFPHTRLAHIAQEEGMIGPGEDFLRPVFYLSPHIKEEILPLIEAFAQAHPNWIFPGLKINMNHELQKKLRRFGIKGPLWEYMRVGRHYHKK